jgi:hypothetical protein
MACQRSQVLSFAGLAFSEEERGRLYLRGLLPPAVLSQEVQAERSLINIRSKSSDLERHTYLTSLQVPHRRLRPSRDCISAMFATCSFLDT